MERFEHGGNILAAARQSGLRVSQLLDYSANINPLGLAAGVREALVAALPDIVHYPDAGAGALKDAIAARYGVRRELIIPGNGASELLYVLCHMLRPERVLVTAPTFSEYERAARAGGAAVEYFFLQAADGFRVDVGQLIRRIAGIDLIFLCNPNNPTGRALTAAEIETVAAAASCQGTLLVVDESFLDFLPDEPEWSCRSLQGKYPGLIVLKSLTKFYAIPGLRLGFALAGPETAAKLAAGKDGWSVNSLAQAAGCAALADEGYRLATLRQVSAARELFTAALGKLPGLRPFAACANFILADIAGTGLTAAELGAAMARRGILIRDCGNYPGLSPAYIRLAVKLPEDNEKVVANLEEIIRRR